MWAIVSGNSDTKILIEMYTALETCKSSSNCRSLFTSTAAWTLPFQTVYICFTVSVLSSLESPYVNELFYFNSSLCVLINTHLLLIQDWSQYKFILLF